MQRFLTDKARMKALLLAYLMLPFYVSAEDPSPVTAIASHNTRDAAFIGYASGVISYCSRLSGCAVLDGTPEAAVTTIDVPRQGKSVRAWVGYDNGEVYFCTLTGDCVLQEEGQKWEEIRKGE